MGRAWVGNPRGPPAHPVQGMVWAASGKASSQETGPRGSAKCCQQAPPDPQENQKSHLEHRAVPRQGRRGGAVQESGPVQSEGRAGPIHHECFLPVPLTAPGVPRCPLDFPRP